MGDASEKPATDAGPELVGRRRSALLWGAVGVLGFLVLLLAYEALVATLPLSLAVKVGVALAAGVVAAAVAYRLEHRLVRKGRP